MFLLFYSGVVFVAKVFVGLGFSFFNSIRVYFLSGLWIAPDFVSKYGGQWAGKLSSMIILFYVFFANFKVNFTTENDNEAIP